MDDLNRSRIRQTQQQAKQPTQPLTYRIGDRDPATGKYEMIYPDGSKATGAEKLYSAASTPGDRVLAQQRTDGTWLLSEAGASRRRKTAAPSAMPPRVRKRSQVWVLYEFEGGLWVGGHQAVPERIGDRPSNLQKAWIWGDAVGWEASLTRGDSNQPGIIAISSKGTISELNNTNSYMYPLGAGYWDVLNKGKAFQPANDGVTLYGGANRSFTFTCDVGYWSAPSGFIVDRVAESVVELEPENQNSETNLTINTIVTCPLAPSGKRATSTSSRTERYKLSPPISSASLLENTTRSWMCDRYSSLVIRTTRASINTAPQFTLLRESEGRSEQLAPTSAAIPYAAAGSERLYIAFGPPITPSLRWNFAKGLETFRNVAPLGGSYTTNDSTSTNPPTKDLSYTNGKMIAVVKTEIDKLKLSTQNINIAEVAVNGAETIAPVLGFAIPSTANILSYCGSLI